MGRETTTTWTCDRCLAEIVMPEREQPPHWITLAEHSPPLSAEPQDKGLLCGACLESLNHWWLEKAKERVDARAAV